MSPPMTSYILEVLIFKELKSNSKKKINRINSNWKIHKPNLDF